MWDDVVIGKGKKGNSAIKVFSIPMLESVSENAVSYWIRPAYLDFGMIIMKDTAEGRELEKILKQDVDNLFVRKWIEDVFIKNVDPMLLKKGIERALDNAYLDGKRAKAKKICEALYL